MAVQQYFIWSRTNTPATATTVLVVTATVLSLATRLIFSVSGVTFLYNYLD